MAWALRPPLRLLATAALATVLFAGALRAFFASVYYHNLTSLGLNATALFALALLAPLAYLVAPRALARPRPVLLATALLLAAGRAGMSLSRGTLAHLAFAGLAAASFLVLLPALLRTARGEVGDQGAAPLAAGVAVGWAVDAAILLLGGSFDPTVTPLGLLALLPLGAALAWLSWRSRPVDAWPSGKDPLPARWRLALAGLGLGAALFLQNVVLGAPHAIARWGPHPLWLAALGTLAGLAAGAWLVLHPPPRGRAPLLLGLHAAGLAGALDHGLLHTPLAPLLLGAAQAAIALDLALLAALLGRATLRQAGVALAWGALALLVLHFLSAFAFTFAYVPLGEAWRGLERVLPAAAFLLVALGALAAARKEAPPPPRPAPRRAAATLLALLVVAPLGALALPAAPVEAPAEGRPLRVVAFNVHQGFSNAGAVDPWLFVEVLRELDADVVALQESDTPRFTSANVDVVRLLARELGYHEAYGPPTREQGVGVGLLSRLPVREWSYHALPSTSDNRFFLEARLDHAESDLWVYVIHLGLPRDDRVAQADALLARAATRAPRLLAGDFNSCPDGLCPRFKGERDDVYARVTAAHADGWTQLGRDPSDPAAYTYDAAEPFERIDYVFLGPGLTATRYETVRSPLATAASDHLPVLAEVVVA